jgi:hypothetical protein
MLAACAAPQAPIPITGAFGTSSGAKSKTYTYTGSAQTFRVPHSVTQLTVAVYGPSGPRGEHRKGGKGGFVQATIPVRAGEKLAIVVGGEGGRAGLGTIGTGGFNGGADGGATGNRYDFGGTAAAVRPTCAKAVAP